MHHARKAAVKFLFEIFPVLIFFIAFKVSDIYVATAVAIAATVVQAGWSWFRRGKIEKMLLINLGIIVVFGGATLLLHDETSSNGSQPFCIGRSPARCWSPSCCSERT